MRMAAASLHAQQAREGCSSLPTQGSGLEPGAGRGTAQGGPMETEVLLPHQGMTFSGSNSTCAPGTMLGPGTGRVSPCLPGSSIPEWGLTQRARSPHLPNSQRRPKNPGGHWQMVTFPSRQLPPLRHSQPSESSAREKTGASQDPSCLQGWDSQAVLPAATYRRSSGGWQPQAPPTQDTQAQPPSVGQIHCSAQ